MNQRPGWGVLSEPASRRQFLKRSSQAALLLSGGSLLAACSEGDSTQKATGGPQIARPGDPVTLTIYDDNPPIDDGLDPEKGPLKVFNWTDYVYKKVLNAFSKEYGVEIEYINFSQMSEAVSKIRSGAVEFDVFFPTIDQLGKLVAAKLLKPLNRSYVPNLDKNIWPQLIDPFYDRGSRYTVPYVTWTTGIGYRADEVKEDLYGLPNPYDALWDSLYQGKVGVYDEYRTTMALALLRDGVTDINSSDPEVIKRATDNLKAMAKAVNVRVGPGDYQRLAEGTSWLHESWSGNMAYAQYYLPKGVPVDVLGYWYPPDGRGMVDNDAIAVSAKAKNPVLAHHFINFLLDSERALVNFGYEGYMPPQQSLDPERAVADGYIPENLKSVIVKQEDFSAGYRTLELRPEVDALWQEGWSDFQSGV